MTIANSRLPISAILLACGIVSVLGAPATQAADRLATAKTAHVKEVMLRADDSGKLKPAFKFTVDIARPN